MMIMAYVFVKMFGVQPRGSIWIGLIEINQLEWIQRPLRIDYKDWEINMPKKKTKRDDNLTDTDIKIFIGVYATLSLVFLGLLFVGTIIAWTILNLIS